MLLQEILEHNDQFVAKKEYVPYETTKMPQKRMVVVSCMDARLIELLPKALDIHNGDAKIIKNAGGTISHAFGSIMRSIVTSVYELNAEEIYIIGHHGCGMSQSNPQGTLQKMVDRGVTSPMVLSAIEYAGVDLHKWLFGFDDVVDSITANTELVRNHPLIPKDIPVHGLVIDPQTGKLDVIVDGYKDLARSVELEQSL
ncbi:beta-class carbonic anhydrase [Planococcus kocurii]|uniref:carbonic anhydrase n=1 Tax=Planococcus kocurii TaxID=1374 RepID=A0ABM5WVR4_9BACL|nr:MULTISPECIES: carbonic anhydrase [Planococcus]ALS77419.1 carbonic anhydrase [Planococcus kocurii]KAA0959202.1 carbonic anhydrase [Planococcus sp. ANT_H30]